MSVRMGHACVAGCCLDVKLTGARSSKNHVCNRQEERAVLRLSLVQFVFTYHTPFIMPATHTHEI